MENAFGKIVGIFLAAAVMFGLPVIYMAERQESVQQMFIQTETVYLVDSVRNTGVLTRQMLEEYERKLGITDGICRIELMHMKKVFYLTDDGFEEREERYYTADIRNQVYKEGAYSFGTDDYFKVTVREEGRGFLYAVRNIFYPDQGLAGRLLSYYGGTVKYEVH